MRVFRLLLMLLLVTSAARAEAVAARVNVLYSQEDTRSPRVAVIYAEADAAVDAGLGAMIAGMERSPGIEVVRMQVAASPDAGLPPLALARRIGGPPLLVAAAEEPIAVLYPDIGEPYRSVIATIIEGIEKEAPNRITRFAIGGSFDAQDLSSELKRQKVRVVIALGRNGLRAASSIDKDIAVVAGGIVSASGEETARGTVLSLAPDPALLFSRLKLLAPRSRRVFVAYEPRQNAWLIELARDAAKAHGLQLIALPASDIKGAAEHYRKFFADADPQRDALWLPQDTITANESTILPLVLQESWTKGIAVFSSSAPHVQRGVLFALYPNNAELGRKLAASALDAAAGSPPAPSVLPLRDVLAAVNTRTARRLGIDASEREFDLVFPQ